MQTSFGMALQRLHHPEQHPGRLHNEQHPAAWFEWGAQWLVYSIDTPSWQALATRCHRRMFSTCSSDNSVCWQLIPRAGQVLGCTDLGCQSHLVQV